MRKIELKNRFTGAVLYSTDVDDGDQSPVRTALERAAIAGAPHADLRVRLRVLEENEINDDERALIERRISDVKREIDHPSPRANLADANLADANLAGANLADANLAGAYLADAYLARAKNIPPGIDAKDPETPYVRAMAQTLAERAQRYRSRHPDVPVIERLDAKILESLTTGGSLRQAGWHTCETTHCRGGWAIHHAGPAGYELERKVGVERAAALIYMVSTGRAPHFYATDERALADIKACAAAQVELAL